MYIDSRKKARILVVHEGKRDDYQVVKALAEAGHQVTLVTSAYSTRWAEVLGKFPFGASLKRLAARRIDAKEFPCVRVLHASLHEIIWRQIVARMLGSNRAQEAIDVNINRRAEKIVASDRWDLVLAYNYNAFDVFSAASAASIPRVLFQCHPHPASISFIRDQSIVFGRKVSFSVEREFCFSGDYRARLFAEHLLATEILVASSFTADGLSVHAGAKAPISVVPYGTKAKFRMAGASRGPRRPGPLRVLFVGQFVARKGMDSIVDALNKVDFPIEATFVGRGLREINPKVLVKNKFVRLIERWSISDSELVETYAQNDMLLFPTLVEGFAHVVLEAMAAGCVPVVTRNCCGPDLVTPSVDGYLVSEWDCQETLKVLQVHPDGLGIDAMSQAAVIKAATFTWESFRRGVVSAVERTLLQSNSRE